MVYYNAAIHRSFSFSMFHSTESRRILLRQFAHKRSHLMLFFSFFIVCMCVHDRRTLHVLSYSECDANPSSKQKLEEEEYDATDKGRDRLV